jgi:hypothetical protein
LGAKQEELPAARCRDVTYSVNFRYLIETGTTFDTRGNIAALTITVKAF